MPDWQDEGFVLGGRRFGENGVILSVFTKTHGRHLGLVRSKRMPMSGSFVNVKWHARLSEHLGTYSSEIIHPLSAILMDDRKRLAAIGSICALLDETLPERENTQNLYEKMTFFLDNFSDDNWQAEYVRFELNLLAILGFGLDLSECAGGGSCDDLAYVSPKTGRAVSREKGNPYREKLLPLPRFLWQETSANAEDIKNGLILTGYFLSKHVKTLPITRQTLMK